MKAPLISSKKISLTSDYNYFDLLPNKKHHQCNTRIPQTILLQKGFIKDWIFNSHKLSNHPILKKRKQNLSTFAVIKTFCIKNGYLQTIQGCNNIREVRDRIREAVREQKDYDFVKDKKVIQITTVSNQVLVMTLVDFLDYVAENKYSQQNFYEKWKMIQEKVSFTKIDEYYKVQNVRNNHIIESKCQKIISVNTTEVTIQSTQLEDDPYKNASPSKTYQIAQTKNIEGYKFFDTFLNKKFFQMSTQIIQFIEKNFKCLVQSVQTRFVINKERQPYLVGISELEIKPAKKIADMREFQNAKEKGYVRLDQYERCLETYLFQNMQKTDHYNINTPLSEQRRKKCKGKFCKLHLQQTNLPALLQHKLKLPSLSSQTRVIQPQLRDAVLKRRRRILQKLMQHKIISQQLQIEQQSSEYETEGEEQSGQKNKNRLLKVCQNCYTFYFHVNRFFDLDVYGNLVERKVGVGEKGGIAMSQERESQIKGMSFLSRDQLKKIRSKSKIEAADTSKLDQLGAALINEKQQAQQKAQYQKQIQQIKPVTNLQSQKLKRTASQSKIHQKSLQKPQLSPIKQPTKPSLSKTQHKISSQKKLPYTSKLKLDPITHDPMPITKSKKQIVDSIANNYDSKQTKGHRLMTLTKLSQPVKLQERTKSKTMMNIREKRPQNFVEACEQVVKKLGVLPDSSREELIYYAKKYYKDNLPQPIQRRSYSSYTQPHLYQFMSISPVSIHPKRRIKRRPQMSLKRLSQLTDYPQIVSRSQFIFDTVIINQQTTIPFCALTTKIVNPDNIIPNKPYQNIFIVADIFDCFIENIALSKQLLEEEEVYNKRIVLFNYPGQSHTIYNRGNVEGYSAYFGEIMDKLVYRLSGEKGELGVIDLEKDLFKFCGFGYGAYLLSSYLGSYSLTFGNNISSVMLVNPFMQYPKKYSQLLSSLLTLYTSPDPTVEPQSHLYYNKAINSQQTSPQDLQHKSGLNPIRVQDRIYLLQCAIAQNKQSETTTTNTIQPQWFQMENKYQVSVVYGKSNSVVPKESAMEFLRYRGSKQEIGNRVIVEIYGGHDIMADNYDDMFRIMTLFLRK